MGQTFSLYRPTIGVRPANARVLIGFQGCNAKEGLEMMSLLDGRVATVTGGGRSLGRSDCWELVRRGASLCGA